MEAPAEFVADFWRDKARGVLLGAACGDAPGAAFLHRSTVSTLELRAREHDSRPLEHSAATEQLLAAAHHHAVHRHAESVDQEALTAALAQRWWTDRVRAGYSRTDTLRFGEALGLDGTPDSGAGPHAGSPSHTALTTSVLPLLVVHTSRVGTLAASVAAASETDPADRAAVKVHACAVTLAFAGSPFREVEPDAVLARLVELGRPSLVSRLGLVRQLAGHSSAAQAASEFDTASGSASEVVVAALLAFLRHPDDPVSCVSFAIRLGGHVSSTAALAGSLVGARVGAAGIPRHLRERLTARDELTRVADRLVRRKIEQAV